MLNIFMTRYFTDLWQVRKVEGSQPLIQGVSACW
jgi:hypothetical protein